MPDITFLMGQDPAGASNQFYSLAKKYFVAAGSTVVDAPSANGQTLEGVFAKLTSLGTAQTTINLVSHATGFASMEFGLTAASGHRWTDEVELQNALSAKVPAAPGPSIITNKTRVVLYGCDVGRTLNILTLLSGLFGSPGELLAPKRVAVFLLDGTTVKYRLAQTWSMARSAPLVVPGTAAPAVGWPAFRKSFVADASLKFGRAVLGTGDLFGDDALTKILTDAASTATTVTGKTFFFDEGVDIIPATGQTPAQAVASISPKSNGDPITSPAKTVAAIDDTTVVTTVKSSDAYATNAAKTTFAITVAILAQIIDQDPVIAQGADYASVTVSPARSPALGPKAASTDGGDGGGGGGAVASGDDPMQTAIQALLDGGASQADIDALTANDPTGDGTADIDTDAPQVTLDAGDSGSGSPETLESA